MSEIKVTINGKELVAEAGQSILQIATDNNIDIPNLCNNPQLAVYGACGLCTVEVAGIPKLLRACATKATDGMVITTNTARTQQSRKIALELLMSDHEGDCIGPCKMNCPAETDCQAYVKQIALGNYHEAVQIIKQKLPLPASIGRVCPHPCEKACRRNYVEQPISIAHLKSFAADRDLESNTYKVNDIKPHSGKKVAVVGGGPSGLTAAFFLARAGHSVTIYEAMEKMGGMLRYGIPQYRLPKQVLDREISEIKELGIQFINNVKIGVDYSLQQLKESHDAVILAIGAWKSSPMRCEGEGLSGVWGGIDFLREVSFFVDGKRPSVNMGAKVAVVGGGNTAMDACRSAVRLGAKQVYVIYRRTRNEMPAEQLEILEAEEEGVVFKFLTNPAEILGKDGKVCGIKLQVMELGEPDASGRRSPKAVEGKFEYLDVDTVIVAIGQTLNIGKIEGVELNKKGNIVADESTFQTNIEGVFAIGDATNKGAGIAIAAIGEANKAAKVVDSYLAGDIVPYKAPFYSTTEPKSDDPKFTSLPKAQRSAMPHRSPLERKADFNEINLGLDEEKAQAEAKRCLECGCHDYSECKLIKYANGQAICPDRLKGAKNYHETERKLAVIERNPNKCVLCGLCVRVCDEVAHKGILALLDRGFNAVVKAEFDSDDVIKHCVNCLKCAELCPTGALKIIKK